MCPLNETYWVGLPADKLRLQLYVGRKMWRWWSYEDGTRKKCHGVVEHVTGTLQLGIKYDDGT